MLGRYLGLCCVVQFRYGVCVFRVGCVLIHQVTFLRLASYVLLHIGWTAKPLNGYLEGIFSSWFWQIKTCMTIAFSDGIWWVSRWLDMYGKACVPCILVSCTLQRMSL